MAERFTILDDGETLITGEWTPDPEQLSLKLLALANSYDNMLPPLLAAKQAAQESTALHFETESDPRGNKWVPLDSDYLEEKVAAGYPADEILVRTGAGRDAAVGNGAWFISEDALWFDPNALPHYMDYHQAGTINEGAESALANIRNKVATREDIGTVISSGGRGNALPKREFVGFDETDTAVFEEIFNSWFATEFYQEFPPGGGNTETGFNMQGEFPVIGVTKRGQPILRTPAGPRFGRF